LKESKNAPVPTWNRNLLTAGALLGIFGIAFGAMGAHPLREILSPEELESYRTAIRYQLFGAITLLILGFVNPPKKSFSRGAYTILLGTSLFSGSIYLLLLGKHLAFSYSWIGPITPLGGTLLIAGWIFLLWGIRSN